MLSEKILERYRVTDGDKFKLKDYDPGDTGDVDFDKKDGKELLEVGVKKLASLQERLYAEGRWAILMVLQGIDTAGKDGEMIATRVPTEKGAGHLYYKNVAGHLLRGKDLVITPELGRRVIQVLDLASQSMRAGKALKAKYK